MVEVIIGLEGDKSKNRWGYEVTSPLEASTEYGTRARLLDGYILLEERRGSSSASSVHFTPFGIVKVDEKEKANERMIEKAREHAKGLMEKLVPNLIEKI